MKLITTITAAFIGLLFCGIVAVICERDDAPAQNNYDQDEDGGFFDDWRLP